VFTIFWRGNGWIVPAATFGISLLAEIVSERITGDDNYYQSHGLAFAVALWTSAIVNGIVFCFLYSDVIVETLAFGAERAPDSRAYGPGWLDHSFMFINQGAWVVIMIVGGLWVLVSQGL
jgi:hypothetical protein